MKKLSYLIGLTLILGLVLTGCSVLSNISQVPATEQKCIIVPIEEPICLGAGGGKTIGFWGNKNGQKILDDKWSGISGVLSNPILAGLPNTNAAAPYLNSPAEIKVFLRKATAKDMQYMLAAQWLAMLFNVKFGDVDGGSLVYPVIYLGVEGSMTVQDVLDNVSVSWNGWDRTTQEYWKNILDDANNNLNFKVECPYDDVQGILTGTWLLDVNSGAYMHDMFILTQDSSGVLTGTGGYPVSGPYNAGQDWTLTGQLTGTSVTLNITYTNGYNAVLTGTVNLDWNSMNGTGTSGVATWVATRLP